MTAVVSSVETVSDAVTVISAMMETLIQPLVSSMAWGYKFR